MVVPAVVTVPRTLTTTSPTTVGSTLSTTITITTTTTSNPTETAIEHAKMNSIVELSGISFAEFDDFPDNLDEPGQKLGDIAVQDVDIDEANRGLNSKEEDLVDDMGWP